MNLNEYVWKPHWGETYDISFKQTDVGSMLCAMEEEGRIGKVVVDVGSGASPISSLLKKPHRIVNIDIASDQLLYPLKYVLEVQLDIECIREKNRRDIQKKLIRIARHIGAPIDQESPQCVDTFIFGEILNYVDWRETLENAEKYLNPRGSFFIVNRPRRGFPQHFHSRGLHSNDALKEHLAERNFSMIEIRPWAGKTPEFSDIDPMILLFAQKHFS